MYVKVPQSVIVTHCVQFPRYASGLAKVEVRDQYLVRAHYALGKLVSELSSCLKVRPAMDFNEMYESLLMCAKILDVMPEACTSSSRLAHPRIIVNMQQYPGMCAWRTVQQVQTPPHLLYMHTGQAVD